MISFEYFFSFILLFFAYTQDQFKNKKASIKEASISNNFYELI